MQWPELLQAKNGETRYTSPVNMLTVTARPWLSPGMSLTSIVPALSGRKTDRVMLRFRIPERASQLESPGTRSASSRD